MSSIMGKTRSNAGWRVLAILATVLFWGGPEGCSVRSSLPDNDLDEIQSRGAKAVGLEDMVGLFFRANNRVVLAIK